MSFPRWKSGLALLAMSFSPTAGWADDIWHVLGPDEVTLVITSTTGGGTVSQTTQQTITFTFDEAVTGFDSSDVTVTGGTKGTFTAHTDAVYSLGVTGTGGTVTASVPAGAALSAGAGFPSSAAKHSNFYQDTWTLDLDGGTTFMELIRIPAGTFTMGSPEGELSRQPTEVQHTVTLTQDFYLGKTEVTQRQWLAIRGSWPGTNPNATNGVGDNFPAYFVSWNDIQTFLSDLDEEIEESGSFGLPTEAQWEYACRAGTTTRFNFGNGFGEDEFCSAETERASNMWYCGNDSPNGTKAVGQKPANAWGLHDMHGNVWERCSDRYDDYPEGPAIDPTGPEIGTSRVSRGGSWFHSAQDSRSANRNGGNPDGRSSSFGFRVRAFR